MIMWVCPKCGAVKHGFEDDTCELCKCEVISTGVTWDDYLALGSEKWAEWKREMSLKLAPNATAEDRRRSDEYDAKSTGVFVPKCPTCGAYARRLSSNESSAYDGYRNNKTGKTFICERCGYTW